MCAVRHDEESVSIASTMWALGRSELRAERARGSKSKKRFAQAKAKFAALQLQIRLNA